MKNTYRVLNICIIAIILTITSACIVFAESPNSGSCGDNATYEYNPETKTLTISGTGAVDFSYRGISLSFKKEVETIVVNEGITELKWMCFIGYDAVRTVKLPESLNKLGGSAFEGCNSLEEINLPPGIDRIGNSTFEDCKNLKHIDLPENLVSIGWNAFESCDLEELTLPDGLETIGDNAFYENKNLSGTLVIPASVDFIGERAFSGSAVTEVIYEEGVEVSRDWYVLGAGEEFSYCHNLRKVTLPGTMKTTPKGGFIGCDNLTEVLLGEGIESVGGFSECTSLKQIVLPSTVKEITIGAFWKDVNLKSVVINGKINKIWDDAFSNTGIKTFVFPYGIKVPAGTDPNSQAARALDKFAVGYNCKCWQANNMHHIRHTKRSGIVIYGKKGYAEEKYAKEKGFTFKDYYSVSSAKVSGLSSQEYTGSRIRIEPVVKIAGKLLEKDTDYTLEYANTTKIGTATVTIKGCGKYHGTLKKTYKIIPKQADVRMLTPGKGKLTVKAGTMVKNTGGANYQIYYKIRHTGKWNKTTSKYQNKTIKGLKKGKQYSVKIRAYKTVNKKKYYGKWSSISVSDKVK